MTPARLRHADRGKQQENQRAEGEIMSKTDEAKGRTKEAVGALTDDRDLKREGKIDRAAGKAKESVDKAAEKAKDALTK
jgi:uncharacterized protein YjbJ (UPF0337 family)